MLTPLLTFAYESKTNAAGHFSFPHYLMVAQPTVPPNFPLKYKIWGMTVAIQHTNGNWHTIEISNAFDNRFWWNNTNVEGQIVNLPAFANRPVRVVVSAQPLY